MQHQGLGGHLHDDGLDAAVRHLPEDPLQVDGFGRRVGSRDPDLLFRCLVEDLDGPDQAGPDPRRLQDRPDHIGRRCLALCPGHADDLHLPGGVAVPGRRDHGHGQAGIFDTDDDGGPPVRGFIPAAGRSADAFRDLRIPLDDQGRRALLHGVSGKFMSVLSGSCYTEEKRSVHDLSGIVGDGADFPLQHGLPGLCVGDDLSLRCQ